MEQPKRKHNRLKDYDYSTPNAYFITICAGKRRNIFWDNIGNTITCPQDVTLSRCGFLVEQAIMSIPRHYPALSVDRYVVMPDHVHLLLRINSDDNGRRTFAPTISTVIQQMKGTVTKKAGFSVWQKGFHDHVVRGEQDYQEIWKYIESNPVKWADDHVWEETP